MSREQPFRKPPALRRGDRVGIFAPSFPSAMWYPDRHRLGLHALSQAFSIEVVEAPQVRTATGFTSGAVEQRAQALREFIADPAICAIFSTIGGFNSAELLPFLETSIGRCDPKIIVGYSDCTALLTGVFSIGGWCTFYGPAT